MNERRTQWIQYSCLMEDKPASYLVDINLNAQEYFDAMPIRMFVGLIANNVDENLFPIKEEMNDFYNIEDSIVEKITGSQTVLAGTITSNKTRFLFFYGNDYENFKSIVDDITAPYSQYEINVNSVHEADWETYREFLFPTEQQIFYYFTRLIINNLTSQGDQLEKSRTVDFHIDCENEETAQEVKRELENLGYSANYLQHEAGYYGVHATIDMPIIPGIHEKENELIELANKFNSAYSGWGTHIMK